MTRFPSIPPSAPPRVALFYCTLWANRCQHHANYGNEHALAGAARVLDLAGLTYACVSEATLEDLPRYEAVLLAETPVLPQEARAGLEAFLAAGGKLLMAERVGQLDEHGRPRAFDPTGGVLRLPAATFLEASPAEGAADEALKPLAQQLAGFLASP